MESLGILGGEKCNRNGCDGVMKEIEQDRGCSCHINPPCSYCVDMCYSCSSCGYETEPPEITPKSSDIKKTYWPKWKTYTQRFNELKDDEFNYISIPGSYYWMEYKGKYPKGMSISDIVSKFNTCFGYKWVSLPSEGMFHIKVYTD